MIERLIGQRNSLGIVLDILLCVRVKKAHENSIFQKITINLHSVTHTRCLIFMIFCSVIHCGCYLLLIGSWLLVNLFK